MIFYIGMLLVSEINLYLQCNKTIPLMGWLQIIHLQRDYEFIQHKFDKNRSLIKKYGFYKLL